MIAGVALAAMIAVAAARVGRDNERRAFVEDGLMDGYGRRCEVASPSCEGAPAAFDRVHGAWCCLTCWAAQPIEPRGCDGDEFARQFPETARRLRITA